MRIKKCLLLILTLTIVISSLAGINVSAAWVTGDNIAPKAKLSAWPVGGDVGAPESVIDGVIGSGVGGTSARWYAYTYIDESYIEFDFGETVSVGGAKIISGQTNTSTSAPNTLESFVIQYYDGKDWLNAIEVTGNTLMTLSVRFPKMAKASKFRLASRQSAAYRIREFELYEAIDTGSNMVRVPELANTKYQVPYEALANLGVVDSVEGFNAEKIVSKEEFIHYALLLANTTSFNVKNYKSSYTDVEGSKYRDEIVYAELMGYIGKDGSDKFYPKREITFTEATQILLSMGGYDFFAEEKGGYPTGYMYYAAKAGLNSGVEPLKNDYITFGEVAVLLYNATQMPVYEYLSAGNKTTVSTGLTFLEYFRNIHSVSGILYETDTFGIPGTTGEGIVKIGDRYYDIGEVDAKDYVGYRVDAWYVDSADEDTLVYLTPSKNKIYKFDKEEIGKKSDFSTLYYYTEDGKEKTLKIAYDSYVFLNKELGVAYSDDLYTGAGSVTLIDNDNNGDIDVIFIDSVRYMAVASVSNEVIYDKLGGESVDTRGIEEVIIMKDGFRCLLRDLREGDVLAVSKDVIGSNLTIYVSDKKVTGTATQVKPEDNIVVIDDKEYKYIEETETDLEIGMTADFHLDHNGTVAYVDNKLKFGLQYGLMLGFGGDEWKVRTKIMDTDGKVGEYDMADKVLHNDVSVESPKLLKNEMLFDSEGKFAVQVVKFRLGADGKVKQLYTAGITAPSATEEAPLLEEAQNAIVRYKDSSILHYSKPILTESGLGRTMVLSPETLVFDGPIDSTDASEYSVSTGINGLTGGEWFGTVCTYDLSYNNVPAVLFYRRDPAKIKLSADTQTSVIVEKQQIYDEATKDVKTAFKVLTAGKESTVILNENCIYDATMSSSEFLSSFGSDYKNTDFETLGTGDVIQYGLQTNEVRVIKILAKASDLKNLKATNKDEKIQTTGGSSVSILPSIDTGFGSAYSCDGNAFTIKIDDKRYTYSCPTTVNVYIYDTNKNTVTTGSLDDVAYLKNSAGESKVFVRANAKKLQDIMIVE